MELFVRLKPLFSSYAGTDSTQSFDSAGKVYHQHVECHAKGGGNSSRVGLETNGTGVDPTYVILQVSQ